MHCSSTCQSALPAVPKTRKHNSAKRLIFSCFGGNQPHEEESVSSPRLLSWHHSTCEHMSQSARYDENLVAFALQSFQQTSDTSNRRNAIPSLEPTLLARHERGAIVVGWNCLLERRTVVRVTRCHPGIDCVLNKPNITADDLWKTRQSGERLLLFSEFLEDQKSRDNILSGLAPHASRVVRIANRFVVEQFEEILYEGQDLCRPRRLDLQSWVRIQTQRDPTSLATRRERLNGLLYLHDVLQGIAAMHSHGWAHLDVSLENVVLSDERAYLIDFESVLPYSTMKFGCMKRKRIAVPMKIPFLPPEHFTSNADDLVSLRAYDVWAFGVMLFVVVFGEFPFGYHRGSNKTDICTLDEEEVAHFQAYGFARFMKKFHPRKYVALSKARGHAKNGRTRLRNSRIDMKLAGDLLTSIFRRACAVSVPEENIESHLHQRKRECSKSQADKERSPRRFSLSGRSADEKPAGSIPVYHCDCRRLTAQEILEHPFWQCVN